MSSRPVSVQQGEQLDLLDWIAAQSSLALTPFSIRVQWSNTLPVELIFAPGTTVNSTDVTGGMWFPIIEFRSL